MIFLLHAKAQRRKGSLFIFLKNFNSYSHSATPNFAASVSLRLCAYGTMPCGKLRRQCQAIALGVIKKV
jgi:hypothetical protein